MISIQTVWNKISLQTLKHYIVQVSNISLHYVRQCTFFFCDIFATSPATVVTIKVTLMTRCYNIFTPESIRTVCACCWRNMPNEQLWIIINIWAIILYKEGTHDCLIMFWNRFVYLLCLYMWRNNLSLPSHQHNPSVKSVNSLSCRQIHMKVYWFLWLSHMTDNSHRRNMDHSISKGRGLVSGRKSGRLCNLLCNRRVYRNL